MTGVQTCALPIFENGEYPADMEVLGNMAEDISYRNAVRYFGFEV